MMVVDMVDMVDLFLEGSTVVARVRVEPGDQPF